MTRVQKYIVFWLVIFTALLLFFSLKEILLPFVAGIVVAYFLDPLLDYLENAGLSRMVAATLVTSIFFLCIIILLILLIPILQRQLLGLFGKLPQILDSVYVLLEPLQRWLQEAISSEHFKDLNKIQNSFSADDISWLINIGKKVFEGGMAIFNFFSLIIITPLVSFYILRDWDVMLDKIKNLIPKDMESSIGQLAGEIDMVVSSFIRGQMIVCAILATLYSIGLSVIGLDFGLLVGTLTGFLAFIPFFGILIGIFSGLTIAYFQFGTADMMLITASIFIIGQLIEGFFLTPKLVGEAVGIHPVWVIFALMAGGLMFGFLGILIAVPVAAVLAVLLRFGLSRYKTTPLYLGDD